MAVSVSVYHGLGIYFLPVKTGSILTGDYLLHDPPPLDVYYHFMVRYVSFVETQAFRTIQFLWHLDRLVGCSYSSGLFLHLNPGSSGTRPTSKAAWRQVNLLSVPSFSFVFSTWLKIFGGYIIFRSPTHSSWSHFHPACHPRNSRGISTMFYLP